MSKAPVFILSLAFAVTAVAADQVLEVAEGTVTTNTAAVYPETSKVDKLIKRGKGTYYAACYIGAKEDGTSWPFAEIVVEEGTLVLACGDRNDANCRTDKITVKSGGEVKMVMNKDRSTANRDAMFQFYRYEPAVVIEAGGTFDCNLGGIDKTKTISGAGTLKNAGGSFKPSKVGDFAGGLLYRAAGSTSISFGDKSKAANDYDFSKLTGVEIDIGYAGPEAGRWTIQNVNPTHFAFFPFVCTFPPTSAAGKAQMALFYLYNDITIDDCFAENIQIWHYGSLTVNGGVMTFRPKANQSAIQVETGASVNLTGGRFSGALRTTDRNYANSYSRIKSNPSMYNVQEGNADLTIDGGEHWYGGQCPYRTVFNGGRIWWGEFNGGANVTCVWDGVTVYGWADDGSAYSKKFLHESSKGRLAMGAKGGRYELIAQRGAPTVRIPRPIYSDVAEGTDGGFTLVGNASWQFESPHEFTGPMRLLDGYAYIGKDSGSAILGSDHPFGYGDLVFGNARLLPRVAGSPVVLANAAGKVLRLAGSAAVTLPLPNTTATPFTVGAAGAAATTLARDAGGVLFLVQEGKCDIDGTMSTFKVNGGVPAAPTGLPKVPVFQCNTAKMDSYSYSLDFMRYDATSGFVKLAQVTRENEVGTSSSDIVLLQNAKTTVSTATAACGALKVERDYSDYSTRTGVSLTDGLAQLYLEDGARLAVGDGTNPAPVILNSYNAENCAAIKGTGVLDFGTSEGVFAVNGRRAVVGVPIAGSGGVTFAGVGSYPGVWLGSDSTYTGGTRINGLSVAPETSGAFGTGDIWIGEGKTRGGRLSLGVAGLDIKNRVHLAGFGSGHDGDRQYGAIYCKAPATLSGAVELTGNSKVVVGADGELTFAGVISGDWGLRIYNTTANTVDPDTGKDVAFARDGVGPVIFTADNTYKGITEVIRSTLVLRGPCSTGTDRLELDSGCLRFENETDVTYTNRVIGSGVIQLAGRGVVNFTGNLEGQEGEQFTLDLAGKNVAVSSLKGIGAITTSRTKPTHLSVLNDAEGSFTGSVPANVVLHYGTRYMRGLVIVIR